MSATLVPTWTLAVSEHSVPDYVYVLDAARPDLWPPGGYKTKLTSRLTPVRQVGVDGFGNPTVQVHSHDGSSAT